MNHPQSSVESNSSARRVGSLSWVSFAPAVFVLLWSTGFIGAKYGLPFAEPFSFLALRFGLVAGIFLLIALVTGAPWPASLRQAAHIAIAGILVHAIYLCGVFASIDIGITTGVSALIVGMQPLLTALLVGPLLGERISARKWFGFLLGFAGVMLVVAQNVSGTSASIQGVLLNVMGLIGITLGVIYQKRFCAQLDLRSGSCIQFASASLTCALFAVAFESGEIEFSAQFIFALLWLIVVLSLGAISLLAILIRRDAASTVASLFYLVPGVVAVEGWLLFDERMSLAAIAGLIVAALGVWLVSRS